MPAICLAINPETLEPGTKIFAEELRLHSNVVHFYKSLLMSHTAAGTAVNICNLSSRGQSPFTDLAEQDSRLTSSWPLLAAFSYNLAADNPSYQVNLDLKSLSDINDNAVFDGHNFSEILNILLSEERTEIADLSDHLYDTSGILNLFMQAHRFAAQYRSEKLTFYVIENNDECLEKIKAYFSSAETQKFLPANITFKLWNATTQILRGEFSGTGAIQKAANLVYAGLYTHFTGNQKHVFDWTQLQTSALHNVLVDINQMLIGGTAAEDEVTAGLLPIGKDAKITSQSYKTYTELLRDDLKPTAPPLPPPSAASALVPLPVLSSSPSILRRKVSARVTPATNRGRAWLTIPPPPSTPSTIAPIPAPRTGAAAVRPTPMPRRTALAGIMQEVAQLTIKPIPTPRTRTATGELIPCTSRDVPGRLKVDPVLANVIAQAYLKRS